MLQSSLHCGEYRAVYSREISRDLHKARTPRRNGTKSTFKAYSTNGQLKPWLMLAEGFWAGFIQAAAYLGRESVRINVLKRCPRLAEAVNDFCACCVLNYTQTFVAERHTAAAGKWRLRRREINLKKKRMECR